MATHFHPFSSLYYLSYSELFSNSTTNLTLTRATNIEPLLSDSANLGFLVQVSFKSSLSYHPGYIQLQFN